MKTGSNRQRQHGFRQGAKLWMIFLCGMLILTGCGAPEAQPPTMGQNPPVGTSPPLTGQNVLLISPREVSPGGAIKIRGVGFRPEETITVVIHVNADSYLYGAQALENGEYQQEIVLLETLPTGISVKIEAMGDESGHTLIGDIQIMASLHGGS